MIDSSKIMDDWNKSGVGAPTSSNEILLQCLDAVKQDLCNWIMANNEYQLWLVGNVLD